MTTYCKLYQDDIQNIIAKWYGTSKDAVNVRVNKVCEGHGPSERVVTVAEAIIENTKVNNVELLSNALYNIELVQEHLECVGGEHKDDYIKGLNMAWNLLKGWRDNIQ